MTTFNAPPRVVDRPRPEQWGLDELMTLSEAAALFWPQGPLSVSSLRNAIRQGRLPVVVVARKHLLTRRAVAMLSEPQRRTGADGGEDRSRQSRTRARTF